MAIKAFIFDFDGLILDTETTDYQAWQEVYAEHGCELSLDVWADCIGRPSGHFSPSDHLSGLLGRPLDSDGIRTDRRRRAAELNAMQQARPGIVEYLRFARVHGIAAAIASSADRPWVTGHLERLGLLEHFACFRCVEDTGRHKPDPAPYVAALEALGAMPHEAVAFEDSPHGVASACAAGIFCVAVPNPVTARLDLAAANLQVGSLAELPPEELLARLNGHAR